MQTGFGTVQISWTAPRIQPGRGYRITINPSGDSTSATASPQTLSVSTPGEYDIQVLYLSQHLPGRMVELEGFVVRGEGCVVHSHVCLKYYYNGQVICHK